MFVIITPRKLCLWGVYCFHVVRPSICPSVRYVLVLAGYLISIACTPGFVMVPVYVVQLEQSWPTS